MGGSIFIDPTSLPSSGYGDLQLLELFIAYAYLLYIGCTLISDGAELLMLTPYSKLVGSCILPVLGAVPDGAIVLFSGLGPNAQSSLDVGVGALAGSTVMLITIPWALAIYGGRVNLDETSGMPKYAVARGQPRLFPANNYWNSGVSVGKGGFATVLVMALWMLVTSVPYFIVEIGALFAESEHGGITNQQSVDDDEAKTLALQESPAALVGLLLSVFFFCAYLFYQYQQAYGGKTTLVLDQITKDATVNTVKSGTGIVAAIRPVLQTRSGGERPPRTEESAETERLVQDGAMLSAEDAMLRSILREFFDRYDMDKNKTLSMKELRSVFADMNEPKSDEELEELFREYDQDKSGQLSFDEFVMGMKTYVQAKDMHRSEADEIRERRASSRAILEELPEEEDDEEEEETPEEFAEDKFKSVVEQQAAIKRSAMFNCLLGTALVLAFSDPITDVLDEVGERTGISAFYVGFVIAPLITNGSELLASYTFALKKTSKSIIVAYEQLLGAAIMNNTYCLSIFLVLIYAQNLYWNYTAEVLAIIFAELVVFSIVTSLQVHTLTTAIFILAIYPATLVIVYCLENFVGIS